VRFIYLLAISAAAVSTTAADAQSIYKCVGKDGRTAYSNSPCPGAKTLGGDTSQPRVLAVESMTQSQADLAADCMDVLFIATQPDWKEKDRETADFNKYCPAFGFKVPFGPDTTVFNRAHGAQLMAKLRRQYEAVPSGSRTYSGGYRTPSTFVGADYAMKESPARPGPVDVPVLPALQSGKWKVRETTAGVATESEICGDPLDNFRREMLSLRGRDPMGCTVRATAPTGRSARIVVDCAADRYENGRTVMKGRTEVSIVSSSPQSVTIEVKSTVKTPSSAEATRIGNCVSG